MRVRNKHGTEVSGQGVYDQMTAGGHRGTNATISHGKSVGKFKGSICRHQRHVVAGLHVVLTTVDGGHHEANGGPQTLEDGHWFNILIVIVLTRRKKGYTRIRFEVFLQTWKDYHHTLLLLCRSCAVA